MNKIKYGLIGLFATLSFGAQAGSLSTSNMVKGTGVVYRVIDGDTYDINVDSQDVYNQLKSNSTGNELRYFKDHYKNFRVRLANTDTAESKHPDAKRNSAEGKTASLFAKQLIEKKRVEFACWDHGRYGRLICSVSVNGRDVGLTLIENGFSHYVTSWGRHPYMHSSYQSANR